jgi:hypothetical protein
MQMNYQLSFLDHAGRIREVREASFESEHKAMCWMWIAGGAWALDYDWSIMELRSVDRCAARIPAKSLKRTLNGDRRAKPRVIVVDSDAFADVAPEGLVKAAGYVTEFFFDNASAEKWLSTHSPDAAVIEVGLWDESCIALAKKLALRNIPFLAVSSYSAASAGIDRIFQHVPWFEKPVASAGLELALGCIL